MPQISVLFIRDKDANKDDFQTGDRCSKAVCTSENPTITEVGELVKLDTAMEELEIFDGEKFTEVDSKDQTKDDSDQKASLKVISDKSLGFENTILVRISEKDTKKKSGRKEPKSGLGGTLVMTSLIFLILAWACFAIYRARLERPLVTTAPHSPSESQNMINVVQLLVDELRHSSLTIYSNGAENYTSIAVSTELWPMRKKLHTLIKFKNHLKSILDEVAGKPKNTETSTLYTLYGDPIENVATFTHWLQKQETSFVLVPKDHYFVWPPFHVGHEVLLNYRIGCPTLTVRTLSVEPKIFEVEGLINDETIENFIAEATPHIGQKEEDPVVDTTNKTEEEISKEKEEKKEALRKQSRSSTYHWLKNGFSDNLDAQLEKCLLAVPASNGEKLQIVHYHQNQHYWAHRDYFDPSQYKDPENELPKSVLEGRNRFISVLYYLNDVAEGGETAFLLADEWQQNFTNNYQSCDHGLKIKPKKGKAIFFYNLAATGHNLANQESYQPRTLHAGCDVLRGEKWAANKWIFNKAE